MTFTTCKYTHFCFWNNWVFFPGLLFPGLTKCSALLPVNPGNFTFLFSTEAEIIYGLSQATKRALEPLSPWKYKEVAFGPSILESHSVEMAGWIFIRFEGDTGMVWLWDWGAYKALTWWGTWGHLGNLRKCSPEQQKLGFNQRPAGDSGQCSKTLDRISRLQLLMLDTGQALCVAGVEQHGDYLLLTGATRHQCPSWGQQGQIYLMTSSDSWAGEPLTWARLLPAPPSPTSPFSMSLRSSAIYPAAPPKTLVVT